MSKTINVSDVSGPKAALCWKPHPRTMARCNRKKGHIWLHDWEAFEQLTEALFKLAELEAEVDHLRLELAHYDKPDPRLVFGYKQYGSRGEFVQAVRCAACGLEWSITDSFEISHPKPDCRRPKRKLAAKVRA